MDDNTALFIGLTIHNIKTCLGDLSHLARTTKARVVIDCMTSFLQTIDDNDFLEVSDEQDMEGR